MAAQIERWRLGKQDDRPGSQDGGSDRKMTAREAKMAARIERWAPGKQKKRPGNQDGRPERKMATREA